jgi:hypothetical protein
MEALEHMSDMYLVIVLLGALIIAEQERNDGDEIGGRQLHEFSPEADDKGHDQEIREIEQVFAGLYPLHIVHNRQVEVQVQYG